MAEIPVIPAAPVPPLPTTAAGVPVAPNATTKGVATFIHPTSAAAAAAVMAAVTAFLAASPHPTGYADYITGAIAALTAAWAILGPKASVTP